MSVGLCAAIGPGCGGDDGGGDSGGGSDASSSSSGAATSPGTMTSSAETGATTEPATSGATGAGTGTEADSAAEAPGTGPGDETGTSESGSDETGEPPVGPYGPCGPGMQCDEGSCFENEGFDMCLPDCGMDLACRVPPGVTAVAECIGAVGMRCMLNCADGATCPSGTQCVDIPIGGGASVFRCLWPA